MTVCLVNAIARPCIHCIVMKGNQVSPHFFVFQQFECALCVFNEDDYHAIQNLYRYDGMAFECGTCLCSYILMMFTGWF